MNNRCRQLFRRFARCAGSALFFFFVLLLSAGCLQLDTRIQLNEDGTAGEIGVFFEQAKPPRGESRPREGEPRPKGLTPADLQAYRELRPVFRDILSDFKVRVTFESYAPIHTGFGLRGESAGVNYVDLISFTDEDLDAHGGKFLAVSDGSYYILLDIENMATVWKRLIDNNDFTREPAMRFALTTDYFAVIKEDYDQKAICMLSTKTGDMLWRTDPKDARSPQPMHPLLIHGDRVYGLVVHPGQGFYDFVGRDARTGAALFSHTVTGYNGQPDVALLPQLFGTQAVVEVQDRQDFELKVFDAATGKLLETLKDAGVGPFGVHGRVSAAVQNGGLILLTKDKLTY